MIFLKPSSSRSVVKIVPKGTTVYISEGF